MKFTKFIYYNNNIKNPNITARAEFFFHYWIFLFEKQSINFDTYFFKSHRTVINKVRLQIEGNFSQAQNKIKVFLINDIYFDTKNIVIKNIKNPSKRRSIQKLKKICKVSSGWINVKSKVLTQINNVEDWLNNEYPKILSECIIAILNKDKPLNAKDIADLKQLANCFIIELFHKGYREKYIGDIPSLLLDFRSFPYKKKSSDFKTKEEFEKYKETTWRKTTLEDQIEAIFRICISPPKTRYVFFRIYDINLRINPVTILDVEFYNPWRQHKLKQRKNSILLIKENFTDKARATYKGSSNCNACVRVEGQHEDQMYRKAYIQVKNALSILNRELNTHGKVFQKNAFITNDTFTIITAVHTNALHRGFKAVNNLEDYQIDDFNFFNSLNKNDPEDQKVINFVATISEALSDWDYYKPEAIWMILEATFGGQNELKSFFKDVYKIDLKYYFLYRWKNFFSNSFNPFRSFSHPEFDYEITPEQANEIGINENNTKTGLDKFAQNIHLIKPIVNTPFIVDIVNHIEEYVNNKASFYNKVDKWIDYMVIEFYAYRNLNVHSNMIDEMFLLKKNELLSISNMVMKVFINSYLKPQKRRSIKKLLKEIHSKAASI